MFRVGIIGPESTGKSTLASFLSHRYNGILVSEYAREHMERLSPYERIQISEMICSTGMSERYKH